jgi:hypothetical protein
LKTSTHAQRLQQGLDTVGLRQKHQLGGEGLPLKARLERQP